MFNNMILNCLVVDDEPLARSLIEGYIRHTPFLKLAGECSNAIDALEMLGNIKVDLLFLDIQMPQLNGIELSKMVKGGTRVIFTTAFEQYAIEGFKVDAMDYLLKPISYAEFLKAASKAQRWFSLEKREPRSIFVKTDYKIVQVELCDILYIECEKDYIKIQKADGKSIMTLMSIKSIKEHLPSETFLQVHRSFIVNMNQIRTIERNRIIFDKVFIPISDTYREGVMDKINSRIIKK